MRQNKEVKICQPVLNLALLFSLQHHFSLVPKVSHFESTSENINKVEKREGKEKKCLKITANRAK